MLSLGMSDLLEWRTEKVGALHSSFKHHTEDNLQHNLNVKQVAARAVLFRNPINISVKAVLELKLSLSDIMPYVAADGEYKKKKRKCWYNTLILLLMVFSQTYKPVKQFIYLVLKTIFSYTLRLMSKSPPTAYFLRVNRDRIKFGINNST